jgi:hypothetical protein
LKIHCDSNCRPCVFEGGPSRNIGDSLKAHFCPTCRSAFFCEIGIVSRYSTSNKVAFFCVDCGTLLIKKTLEEIALEKARFLMDNSKLSKSGRFRPSLISKKATRSLDSLSLIYDTKAASAFHISLVTELTRITGLSPQIIIDFARDFGIGENALSGLSGDSESLLLTLAHVSPKFIEVLHSILIGRDPSIEGGLAVRFSVFSTNIPNIVSVQPSGSLAESGPYDLLAYDASGMRIWIFFVQGFVDTGDLERIVGPMLVQDLSEFSGVSEICIVAQKGFSWAAKQILKKYHGIVTSEGKKQRLIPFELWQEKIIPDRNEIAFENIRL